MPRGEGLRLMRRFFFLVCTNTLLSRKSVFEANIVNVGGML